MLQFSQHLAVVVVATFLIGLYSLFEPFGRDQGIHATIAMALDQGLMIYSEVYNIKPPMTTAVHWLSQAIFGRHMFAIRALDMIIVAATALALLRIAIGFGRSQFTGVSAAILFIGLHYSLDYWSRAQTDGWTSLPVALGLLAALRGHQNSGEKRVALMAVAGGLLCVAILLKYSIVFVSIAAVAMYWAFPTSRRQIILDILWVCLGGVAVAGMFAAGMFVTGSLAPYIEIQNFLVGYTKYSASVWKLLLAGIWQFRAESPVFAPLMWFALIAVIAEWRISKRRPFQLFLACWLVGGFLSGFLQKKGFDYHFVPQIPPIALYGAIALTFFTRVIRKYLNTKKHAVALSHAKMTQWAALVVVVTVVWISVGNASALRFLASDRTLAEYWQNRYETPDFSIDATIAASELLKSRVEKKRNSLFVWGYETMIYFLVDVPPQHRYAYSWPFRVSYYDHRYDSDLLNRLKNNPPDFFVVQSQDSTPWVTGTPKDSRDEFFEFVDLFKFVQEGYCHTDQLDRYEIYTRASFAGCDTP